MSAHQYPGTTGGHSGSPLLRAFVTCRAIKHPFRKVVRYRHRAGASSGGWCPSEAGIHLRPETTSNCECKVLMSVLVEARDGYRTEQHVSVSKGQCINSQEQREGTAALPYAEILRSARQFVFKTKTPTGAGGHGGPPLHGAFAFCRAANILGCDANLFGRAQRPSPAR